MQIFYLIITLLNDLLHLSIQVNLLLALKPFSHIYENTYRIKKYISFKKSIYIFLVYINNFHKMLTENRKALGLYNNWLIYFRIKKKIYYINYSIDTHILITKFQNIQIDITLYV